MKRLNAQDTAILGRSQRLIFTKNKLLTRYTCAISLTGADQNYNGFLSEGKVWWKKLSNETTVRSVLFLTGGT